MSALLITASVLFMGALELEHGEDVRCPTSKAVARATRELGIDVAHAVGHVRWFKNGSEAEATKLRLEIKVGTPGAQAHSSRTIAGATCREQARIIALAIDRALRPFQEPGPPPQPSQPSPPKRPFRPVSPRQRTRPHPAQTTRANPPPQAHSPATLTPVQSAATSSAAHPVAAELKLDATVEATQASAIESDTPPITARYVDAPRRTWRHPRPKAEPESGQDSRPEPEAEGARPKNATHIADEVPAHRPAAARASLQLRVGPTARVSHGLGFGAEFGTDLALWPGPISITAIAGLGVPQAYRWDASPGSRQASDTISLNIARAHFGAGATYQHWLNETRDWAIGARLIGFGTLLTARATGLAASNVQRRWLGGIRASTFVLLHTGFLDIGAEGAVSAFASRPSFSAVGAQPGTSFDGPGALEAELLIFLGWTWAFAS